jgi:ADP-ribose pyrophosphatase YjhB (NUDIX family)
MTQTRVLLVAVVLVEQDRRFLLIRESKPECRGKWFLPGGRTRPGESILQAAVRETAEETGITPELTGLLYIDQMPGAETDESAHRIRFVFAGAARAGALKQVADEHSLCADWIAEDQIATLDLRSPFVLRVLEIYRKDPVILPISRMHVLSIADRLMERP